VTRLAELSEAAWARIERLLPCAVGRSRPWRDHRQVVEGIVYRYRTGIAWRDLPERFGPWQTVWKRHHGFATDGTWDKLLRVIPAEADAGQQLDWTVSVDSSVVRAHQRPQRHRTILQRLQALARPGDQIQQTRRRLPWRPRPRCGPYLGRRLSGDDVLAADYAVR
jgi:transposase